MEIISGPDASPHAQGIANNPPSQRRICVNVDDLDFHDLHPTRHQQREGFARIRKTSWQVSEFLVSKEQYGKLPIYLQTEIDYRDTN